MSENSWSYAAPRQASAVASCNPCLVDDDGKMVTKATSSTGRVAEEETFRVLVRAHRDGLWLLLHYCSISTRILVTACSRCSMLVTAAWSCHEYHKKPLVMLLVSRFVSEAVQLSSYLTKQKQRRTSATQLPRIQCRLVLKGKIRS
jgi:hypothetical protein